MSRSDRMMLRRRQLALASLALLGCGREDRAKREVGRREARVTVGEAVARPPASEPPASPEPPADGEPAKKKKKRKESPHVLHVPAGDVAQGAGKSYSVFGDGHTHPITVDAGAMAQLAAKKFALVKSGPGGPDHHAHWVSVYVA